MSNERKSSTRLSVCSALSLILVRFFNSAGISFCRVISSVATKIEEIGDLRSWVRNDKISRCLRSASRIPVTSVSYTIIPPSPVPKSKGISLTSKSFCSELKE